MKSEFIEKEKKLADQEKINKQCNVEMFVFGNSKERICTNALWSMGRMQYKAIPHKRNKYGQRGFALLQISF